MKDFALPKEALEQHIAVLGKTGSGKTYVAKAIIVEPLLEAGRRVGVVDPTDAWWGLRSSHDGKGAGFPMLVLGGDHADLPLPANSGGAVARLLVEQGVNLVASTKLLTVGERTRWFVDFATTVSRVNRSPLHLVLDEAHNFAPQGKVPDPEAGKMLHAANTLASGGRSIGVRLVMITQRPQKLHKDALTSAETLIAMRVLAPHDRKAVEDWINGCGDPLQGKEVLNSLASLKKGEGWAWYPEGRLLERVKFPRIRTFDSSATPTEGHELRSPKGAAEIDLSEIKTALAEAVREAEANDPKLLRAKLGKLEAELAAERKKPAQTIDPHAAMRAREEGFAEGVRKGWDEAHDALVGPMRSSVEHLQGAIEVLTTREHSPIRRNPAPRIPPIVPRIAPRVSTSVRGSGESVVGGGGLRRMMIALAQRPQGLSRQALGVRAGMSSRSGTFATYLAKGRTSGWINGDGSAIRITQQGIDALGNFEPLPTGRDLLSYWLGELGASGAGRLLAAIASAYPDGLSREQAARGAELSPASGTFATYLSKLRTLELVSKSGELKASDELFG